LPNKLLYYSELAGSIVTQLTDSRDNWTDFLASAGRLYKYSFDEQLMIHAQRPNATACAEMGVWNTAMKRYVRRGSKGIALIDNSGDRQRLRYVFDVSDTAPRNTESKRPFIWELNSSNERVVGDTLADMYGANDSDIANALMNISLSLADEYYIDNSADIAYSTEDSYLEDYDETNLRAVFRETVCVSTAYVLMTRCGIDPALYIDEMDFQSVYEFNTAESVSCLGCAVSCISEEVLREIETAVKDYERERSAENGRNDLHTERGLSDTGHSDTGNSAAEQIRNDEEIIPEEAASEPVYKPDGDGRAVQSLSDDRDSGESEVGNDDNGTGESVTASGQSDRSDGVDSSYEQPEITGGGSDTQRADPQLNNNISDDEINTFLAAGSAVQDGKYRIYSFFLHDHDTREKSDFLKNEYGTGGRTHVFQNTDHSYVSYDSRGVDLKKGNIMNPNDEVILTWTSAADRIDGLINAGMYMSQNELDRLPVYERKILGAEIERFYSGLPDDMQRPVSTPIGNSMFSGFWDTAEQIGDTLIDSPETVLEILNSMRPILENTPVPDRYHDIRKTAFDDLTSYANGTFTLFPSTSVTDTVEQLSMFPSEAEQIESISPITDIAEPIYEDEEPDIPEVSIPSENYRITDDSLGEGSSKVKANANLNAIRTLKLIESENRPATSEEQGVLSKYVGWGGIPQAFDERNSQWSNEYTELKSLLTDSEYESARASTLNAHYTSPVVIRAMYETLERLGFSDGNILEPSCGVGNFFGMIPETMKNANLYGVELDSITGRIASQLYPNANITINGFEKTAMPDAFFDAAVGNVPFGSYKLADKRYEKHNFLIHDYFIAKSLDLVRPGGIIAFVTSKGTLDKANSDVRQYIAQRADLLGAVRLPNNAFLKNAGTEVTSDILFLQKRDRLIDIQPDWVHLGKTENGIPVNSYFADNPEMILGTMDYDDRMYGNQKDTACMPIEGADLAELLSSALSNIHGSITELDIADIDDTADVSIPADPTVRNFSYTVIDDTVYYRENSRMYPADMPAMTLERVKGMTELRNTVHELIDYQLYDHSDSDIREKQARLNTLYDKFADKYGLISDNANSKAFSADSSYYLLCSLEILDDKGDLERKSDMFTKRTIKQITDITAVDTSAEALAVSIAKKARIDMEYMSDLTGFSEDEIVGDLRGVIFCNPQTMKYETADEYLSGNVREKLRTAVSAAESDPSYTVNVTALTSAQPKDLDASEISVRLGSTWIDKEYIQQFVFELLQTPMYLKRDISVNYAEFTGEWNISGKTRPSYSDVLANVTYGTSRMNAYRIIEDTLNLKDVRVYDTKIDDDGREVRVLNKKETTLAQQKQESVKQAFKDWIWRDPDRRQNLVSLYNERFNSDRVREYDGSHIEFTGMSPEITLKQHQKDAVARILYGGNTLLAHEVGAGKTFEMVGAAMESKRLGLCNKSLMAVPNHLTEQMASEFLRLYPSANILVATKKDFETKNRKKFCARISAGDYDAVIIGHSQLEKIPLSKERQERLLREQIYEITEGIEDLRNNNGERFTVKQLEKTKKALEVRLEKLTDDSRKDDVVTFEQLGIDRLFVDESHSFKNLFMYTKMRNVTGLTQTEAQKSSDMFMKCRYMDELTSGGSGVGKGVIFATGTPVTNSMAELYTVQRYLQYDTLKAKNMIHFDSWASTFGETVTSVELAPEGTGYRARTRFAKFQNLPELMNMFCEVADIKTADTLNLPRPDAHYHNIVVKPTDLQKGMVDKLSERAKDVHNKAVAPDVDNMLKITSDGRKIGLDQRLMNDMLPDDPNSKVNVCMENIYKIWEETSEKRLTQLCFCDFSTPNSDGRFNVYDDIKGKLIGKGIPENEIALIHDANTEIQKKELFAKVRSGKVRVLIGSTFKCGAGTNVQDKLIALHDLDCPWRPSDLQQRAGRIVRQGNTNPEVNIFRYVTEGTFDSYLFQTVEKKQEFISQIMTSKSPVRSCDDVDGDALSYAEIKALCAGNPHIKEKMNLDIDVAKLRLLKSEHQSNQYRLQDDLLRHFPQRIEKAKADIAGLHSDISRLEINTHTSEEGISPMTVGDTVYTDRGKAGAAILEACKSIDTTSGVKIGSYRGFDMLVSFDIMNKEFVCSVKGSMTHTTTLGNDSFGNITRINNAFEKITQRLQSAEVYLQTLGEQMENAKTELDKPFAFESELAEKSERLAELDSILNMEDTISDVKTDIISEEVAKSKPSVLETLKQNAEKSRQVFGGKNDTERMVSDINGR
jgi:DNA methylase